MMTTLFALTMLTTDADLLHKPDDPIPAGFHIETRDNKGLWISGLTVLLASYTTSAVCTLAFGRGHGFIPYAGSVLDMLFGRSLMTWFIQPVAFSGQVAGTILLIIGLAQRKEYLVKDKPTALIMPVITPGQYGLAVSGAF